MLDVNLFYSNIYHDHHTMMGLANFEFNLSSVKYYNFEFFFDFGLKGLLSWYMNFSHVTILIQVFLQLHLCVIYDSFTLLKKN